MNKENNKSAAGLRRSAIAERIRLREEWSELKGRPDPLTTNNKVPTRVLAKKPQIKPINANRKPVAARNYFKDVLAVARSVQMSSEVLVGVVALVEVGAESRALALRAALTALGASVVPAWSPIVTHLVWAQGGCRATRAKARALASRLVSPLWVEACAASNKRLPEQAFPAAARASDLPSPRTLRQLLKKAEMENIPLIDLLSDKEDDNTKAPRLRLSSDTELDTSEDKTTDTSRDTTADKSTDTSRDETAIESRVNTAPRRALPISISPAPPAKSRRKLFTQKEAEETKTKNSDDDTDTDTTKLPPRQTRRARPGAGLARAERLARRLVAAATPRVATQPAGAPINKPRIVLTGMGRTERQAVSTAIRSLDGRIQNQVTRKTTHILLGSFQDDTCENQCSGIPSSHLKTQNRNMYQNKGVTVMMCISENNTSNVKCDNDVNNFNISGVANLNDLRLSGVTSGEPLVVHRSDVQKARTLNALAGAARGCRVLYARWALDSKEAGKWIHHHGYEVPHLRKIYLKARIERSALGRMRSEYAYDVFNGMKVLVSPDTDQKDAATQLLKLCGAVVVDGSTGQHGGQNGAQFDMTLGNGDGEVSSKWVFDSVAASRMRTTRRYVNNPLSCTVVTQNNR